MTRIEPLKKHLYLVDERNADLITDRVLGINIDKYFMPSVANIIGTDLSKYKLIKKGLFACNPMHVGRDERLPVALFDDEAPALVSPAYFMFRIKDSSVLNEEYLMMWFRRPEFDHQCWIKTDGSVRGGITWEDICRLEIPVIPYQEQIKLVKQYQVITDRIALKQKINDNLAETANIIYKDNVTNKAEIHEKKQLNLLCTNITDGKHGDCEEEEDSGYYFISAKDIANGYIEYKNARQITKSDYLDAHTRTKLDIGDILFTNSGTLGRMSIVTENDYINRTTFQKSVAILKPDTGKISPALLYLSLYNCKYELIELAHGSAQKNLLLRDIRDFEIIYPNEDYRNKLENQIKPILKLIQSNNEEKEKLYRLSETLLSRITTLSDF